MVELEEMDEDEEDLSGVTKVHAKIFENNTLHVGNIDLTEASEVALKALFSGFGHVVQVTVRVRKEPELSWALITMLTEANVSKITNLKIEAGGKILKTRLVEMHKAKASTGAPSPTPVPRLACQHGQPAHVQLRCVAPINRLCRAQVR